MSSNRTCPEIPAPERPALREGNVPGGADSGTSVQRPTSDTGLDKGPQSLHALGPVQLLRLLAALMMLVSGPLSASLATSDGGFVPPRSSEASREAPQAYAEIRPAVRLADGPFSILSHVFDPPSPAVGDADAPGLPTEIDDDSCDHDFAIAQLHALDPPSFVPRYVKSLGGRIRPSLGHPLGLEEPPRT